MSVDDGCVSMLCDGTWGGLRLLTVLFVSLEFTE